MTRSDAVKVTQALNDIEGFEAFMREVKDVLNEHSDMCDLQKFRPVLITMLEQELMRREKILSDM